MQSKQIIEDGIKRNALMKNQSFFLFGVTLLVASSPVPQTSLPAVSPPTETAVPTETITPTLTLSSAVVSIPCQPPDSGYPATIHYENEDNFGDGYISRMKIEDVATKSDEEIVSILVTQWLEHYKTQSNAPIATIKDYKVEKITLYDASCDPFFEIVAGVRFSIIPAQVSNDYASFPADQLDPNDVWWHTGAPFGIFKDGDFYRLRLVFGWGT
jgi:hypothetical protein